MFSLPLSRRRGKSLRLESLEARVTPASGGLDPFFGDGGVVTTNHTSGANFARDTTVDSAGRVFIVGRADLHFSVACYLLDGKLDPAFGTAGRVTTAVGLDSDAFGIVIDNLGRVVVSGYAALGPGTTDFLLVRYLPDGSLDAAFGAGGIVTTNIATFDVATSVTIDSVGRIVAAGYAAGGGTNFALARYLSDGSLDPSFAASGRFVIDLGAIDDAYAVTVDGSDNIFAAGRKDQDFALLKLNSSGVLDATFGAGGVVTTHFGFGIDFASSVQLDSAGRVVVGGYAYNGTSYDFGVARYTPTGAPDLTFDTDGRAFVNFGGEEFGRDIVVDSTDRILVAGRALNEFGVVRLTTTGTLDNTWGLDGRSIVDFGGLDELNAMAMDSSGRLILTGYSAVGLDSDFAVARLTTVGDLDASFSRDGRDTPRWNASHDFGQATAIDSEGRIVVAGSSEGDMLLTRYFADGTLDTTFGGTGKVTINFGANEFASTVAIDSNGRILVAGSTSATGPGDFAVARLNVAGYPDSSFGAGGKVITPVGPGPGGARAITLDAQGRILVAGSADPGSGLHDFAIVRYSSSGLLDAGFGTGGIRKFDYGGFHNIATAIGIDSAGRIVVAGTTNNGIQNSILVARLNTNGSLDTSFAGGYSNTGFPGNSGASDLLIDSSDRILVAGNALENFALLRYNATGGIDPTFGFVGVVQIDFNGNDSAFGLATDASGRIVLAGSTSASGNDDFAVTQLNADGALDTSFGINGLQTIDFSGYGDVARGVAIDSTGRIIVAGETSDGLQTDFGLVGLQVNRGPQLLAGTSPLVFSEDDSAIAFDPALALSDPDDTKLSGATVQIENYVPGQDVLGFTLVDPDIVASFDNVFGILSFQGSSSVASYETLLQSITYTNTSDSPLPLVRTLVITVHDGALPTQPAVVRRQIGIIIQNDAPTSLDDAVLPAILQGTLQPIGRTIGALFAPIVVDVDGGDSLAGIAVVGNTANADIEGAWEYSTDNITWFPVGTVADDATALALSAQARLRFRAWPWFNGNPTPLNARAIDSTFAGAFSNGATRQTVDVTFPGGITAIASTLTQVLTSIFPNEVGSALILDGNLVVVGTPGNDTITVNPSKDKTQLVVTMNKMVFGVFAQGSTNRIVVHGASGADKIAVSPKLLIPADLHGNAGNDALTGGSGDDRLFGEAGDDKLSGGKGNNLLVGGDGNDKLTGGTGRDVLIGGAGSDKLAGGASDDLLIGGKTDFDADLTGLGFLVAEWNPQTFDYATRIQHLTGTPGGLNSGRFLNATTVEDDLIKDVLTGAAGSDYFVVSTLDTLDLKLKAGEQKLTI